MKRLVRTVLRPAGCRLLVRILPALHCDRGMECTIGYRETEPTCRAALLCDWRICPNAEHQARVLPSPECSGSQSESKEG
jgi:hypothetical protein